MLPKRINRVNSLLKEVISEVIFKDIRESDISKLLSVTSVEITKDLKHAKVFISIIGNDEEKEKTIKALKKAAPYIALHASKKMSIRYFPNLHFKLDTSVDKFMKIDSILSKINNEKDSKSNDK